MAQENKNKKQPGKVFNDPIHGHIEMHPLLVLIIDTPHFQRLRNIKQLGAGYFVYPGASHNRFEHSLGVAHLAGRLVKQLREHQRDIEPDTEQDINDTDELCVQIAGLCHDLGHGPFSHVFDGKFMPEAKALWEKKNKNRLLKMFDDLLKRQTSEGKTIEEVLRNDCDLQDEDFAFIKDMIPPFQANINKKGQEKSCKILTCLLKQKTSEGKTIEEVMRGNYGFKDEDFSFIEELIWRCKTDQWKIKHEDISLEMFDDLIKHKTSKGRTIENVMKEDYGFKDEDFKFIKEMIQPFEPMTYRRNGWPFKGRGEKKAYLYEIVSNKINGIDVDKMDYFARDSYYLGMRSSFDHERFIMFARVCDVNGRLQICQRDKEVRNMYDLFYTRSLLHNRAYQHKVVKIIETMIKDALLAADGKGGIKIAETVINKDMKAYIKLTDRILDKIMDSPDEQLQEAQHILRKIENRQLYHCLLDEKIRPNKLKNEDEKRAERDALVEKIRETVPDVREEDFEIIVITVDYGMKAEDPIEKCRFYMKSSPEEESPASRATRKLYKAKPIKRDEVSDLLPVMFNEKRVHVYYKGSRENQNIIENATIALKEWVEDKK